MRGAAVAAVLLYHADVSWARGGYLGVDAFFVLSGFLITTLLIREHRSSERINLGTFWSRRAVRLLPAMFALAAAVLTWMAFFPDGRDLSREIAAALGYVTNWQLIVSGQSYFDQFAVPSPFQHVWSLAIEEQFYLLWPLVAGAALRRRQGGLRYLGLVALGGAAASALWMAFLFDPATDPSRLYFGTDTRAQSLLIGAGAAVIAAHWDLEARRPTRAPIRLVALGAVPVLLLLWSRLSDSSDWLYRGGFAAQALLVTAVILAALQHGPNPLRAGLSWRPLVALGAMSYGLYLWHWPLFLVVNESSVGVDGPALVLVRLVAALAVGLASYHLLEMPVRRRAASGSDSAVALATLMPITMIVLLLASFTTDALVDDPEVSGIDEDQIAALSDAPPPTLPPVAAPSTAPTTTTGVDADPAVAPTTAPPVTKVLLVGDSVAATLGFGFGEVNLEPGYTAGAFDPDLDRSGISDQVLLWNRGILNCRLFDESARDERIGVDDSPNGCGNRLDQWGADVDAFQPEVVVLNVGAWEVFDRRLDGEWVSFGTAAHDAEFTGRLEEVVDVLAGGGAHVVLLPAPVATFDPALPGPPASQSEPDRFDHVAGLMGEVADARDDTSVIDLAGWVCDGACAFDPDLRIDGLHFSAEGAVEAARWLTPQLVALRPD